MDLTFLWKCPAFSVVYGFNVPHAVKPCKICGGLQVAGGQLKWTHIKSVLGNLCFPSTETAWFTAFHSISLHRWCLPYKLMTSAMLSLHFPNNICFFHVFVPVPQFGNSSTTLVILSLICVIGKLYCQYSNCFDGPWSMPMEDGRSHWQVLHVLSQPFPYLLFFYGPVLSEEHINLTAASKGQVNIRVTCLLLQKLEVIKLTGKACQKLRPAEK